MNADYISWRAGQHKLAVRHDESGDRRSACRESHTRTNSFVVESSRPEKVWAQLSNHAHAAAINFIVLNIWKDWLTLTIDQLKRQARKHGLKIVRRREYAAEIYMLVDIETNFVAAPNMMTLEDIEAWLEDIEAHKSDD